MKIRQILINSLSVLSVWSTLASAEPSSNLYSSVPPLLSRSSEPLVMLVMSVDHELFKKAYPDYSDLDGDGQLDVTYKDSFAYLGYFDSHWCYSYRSADSRFSPVTKATGSNGHYCDTPGAPWSGNFLNWATMSRMDVLRKVLFGGKRAIDTASLTVLERAYLPRDIHAFVKVYSGRDLSSLTPYTGSVSLCNLATTENGEPKVRIASGQWPRWASTDMIQCQWDASDSPASSDQLAENTVRVESCVTAKDAATSDRCREYANGNAKPAGLLQRYGEDGSIRFGLISGSYDKNISGGLLRRNISKIGGNLSSSDDEVDVSTGIFNGSVNGIIQHINRFRIARYSYSQNKYTDCSTYGISIDAFKSGRSTYSNRHCSNWGNPVAEMYLEALRYFAGQSSPTSAFDTRADHQFVPGLATESWVAPVTSANACANCSIILLSSGLNSFDADELASSADLPGLSGTASVNSKTDEVGQLEYNNNFAGNYLVGGTDSTRQCTPKYLNGLSEARGLCPELPQLEGSYQVSGLAFYGNQTDLNRTLDGVQKVTTYSIQLAESIPSFTLSAGGKPVTFQPVCHTSSNSGSGTSFSGSGSDCTLVDVVVEHTVLNSEGEVVEGSLLFTWEDSLWGSDFDYDASSRIKFCVGAQCQATSDSTLNMGGFGSDQVRMAVQVDGVNADLNLRFSYTMTGTYDDGLQNEFVYKGQTHFEVNNFTANGNAAGLLQKPLWFAAKYGGFVDLDGDGTPGYDNNGDGISDDDREWDSRNNTTGSMGPDGLPDNYYFARNPGQLDAQLGKVLQDIVSRVSSATNAALFSNSQTGTGVLYQALFQPAMEYNGKTISWGGMLHALFVDSKGLLREDSNGNDRLDDYSVDKVVELISDPNSSQTLFQRYSTSDSGVTLLPDGALQSLSRLDTVWDARDQLSRLSNLTGQRTFSSLASGGRHILTWLDENSDGVVDTGETLPLTPDTFSGVEGYLGVSASKVSEVINYVRGEELSGTRPRTIDYDADGKDDVWRLGDIIHSTPQLVSAPGSRFDALYSDTTYASFYNQYKNRRHVLYVGANDGMIHAFNGGFRDGSHYGYNVTGNNGEVSHPLGSELWAYTPMNLLPHLQWLREPDYPHVYYMDAEPVTFDANIFDRDDSDYPGGWGTVLVMGMRLGGGHYDVTVGGNSKALGSAYVVLDITNPEKPPELLAEITHPELGFTTSRPTLVKRRVAAKDSQGEDDWSQTPTTNEWYLVFASGPMGSGESGIRAALDDGSSNQNLKLFVYDLKSKAFVTGMAPVDSGIAQAYGGNVTAVDWDRDYQDDAVYLGAIETSTATLGGKILRLRMQGTLADSTMATLLDTGKPVSAAPVVVSDKSHHWLYVGSGRLLTYDDNRTTQTQSFYGFREPQDSNGALTYNGVSLSDLVNTTDVQVYTNGTVNKKTSTGNVAFTVDSSTVGSFTALQSVIAARSGWMLDLRGGGVIPAGRVTTPASRLLSMVLFSEYTPSADSCRVDGSSALLGLHYQTGTASPDPILGEQDQGDQTSDTLSIKRLNLGLGYASSPVIHQGVGGRRTTVIQGAGGSISSHELNYRSQTSGRMSWRQIFGIPQGSD
ncbi:PilC/PilY family type IV pilus protein [Endozoicomonas sp. 4G]|uniref:pilus assembly protein n=1 Tax=Endozoicomonas sp. 4G TaxID=2872754 RepID=UPI00207852F4|nr:PilC/PilY family type IV pilus protein [Endozoicomonas sp. 4G]